MMGPVDRDECVYMAKLAEQVRTPPPPAPRPALLPPSGAAT